MEIGTIGYNHSHNSEFVMDRPNGIGCPLLLLIKTPAFFEIDGVRHTVRENSFILFSGKLPCKYGGLNDSYIDDWVFFGMNTEDEEMLARLDIPVDTVVHLGNIEELSRIIHILTYEHYSASYFHTEIEERYTEILFMKISRILKDRSYLSDNALSERNNRLIHIRNRIYTDPESIPNVEGLAAESGLSRSGFQHLYKKLFGVSVMTDVINGRIENAKRLLSSTNLTVREVGMKCGYRNEYNFMRQFKSRCGQTPTEYRNCIGKYN